MSLTTTAVALPRMPTLSRAETERVNEKLTGASATDIIAWAIERFEQRLLLASSFGDTLLIDIALSVDPNIEVVFLDTGFHFAETLETVRHAMDRYSLQLSVLRPSAKASDLWANGVDACCAARKVTPLNEHLTANADAWMSGMRRADTYQRANAPIVSLDKRGLAKINPLAEWSNDQVDRYIAEHDILVNPLAERGYPSIGCWPCTDKADSGRGGRWNDSSKTECGIHL